MAALGEAEHQDSVIYIGFDERFLKTSADNQIFELDPNGVPTGDPVTEITLNVIRACLVEPQDPPKGCAQFNADRSVVVSSAVEITRMYINGDTSTNWLGSYARVVRSNASATGTCSGIGANCPASVASSQLLDAMASAENTLGAANIESVELHTTHQLSGNVSAACESAVSISELETDCPVQVYYTPL